MALNFNNIQIDEELEKLLPPLSKEDYNILEQSLLKNGFEQKFGRIKVWFGSEEDADNKSIGYIVDGHNRYRICQKHDIELNSWDFEAVFMDSKDEVIKWMYENQLARRNLSEMDKYETVEKYSTFLNDMAKKNQSDGGKGLSNLTRINTRKEKAKMAGTSDGNYYKLDQIKKSGNKEVIEKVRNKEISVDKAYREIKNPKPVKKEEVTPQQQIEKFDNRMNEIDKEISSLRTERETLMRRRSSLFETLDIPCELKYEFVEEEAETKFFIKYRDCVFYIEIDGIKEVLLQCSVLYDESPSKIWVMKIPEKYKNDFIMLWKKAHKEDAEYYNGQYNEQIEKQNKEYEEAILKDSEKRKAFYKQCYRVLAKSVHPDNSEGNVEAMQCLNQLKVLWKI